MMKRFVCLAIAVFCMFCAIACQDNVILPNDVTDTPQASAQVQETGAPAIIDASDTISIVYVSKEDCSWKCRVQDKDIVKVDVVSIEAYTDETYPEVNECITLKFTAISAGTSEVVISYVNGEGEAVITGNYKATVGNDNTIEVLSTDQSIDEKIEEMLGEEPDANFYSLYQFLGEEEEYNHSFKELVTLGFTPGDAWLKVTDTEMYMYLGEEVVHFVYENEIMTNDEGGQFVFQASEKDDENGLFGQILMVSDGEIVYDFRRMTTIEDEFYELLNDLDVAYDYYRNSGRLPANLYD